MRDENDAVVDPKHSNPIKRLQMNLRCFGWVYWDIRWETGEELNLNGNKIKINTKFVKLSTPIRKSSSVDLTLSHQSCQNTKIFSRKKNQFRSVRSLVSLRRNLSISKKTSPVFPLIKQVPLLSLTNQLLIRFENCTSSLTLALEWIGYGFSPNYFVRRN